MLCLACAATGFPLCSACADGFVPARPRSVDGVPILSAFAHTGTAVRLVHNLKYRRSVASGRWLAEHMSHLIPPETVALVPLPRVVSRRIAHGIDQTVALASEMSALTDVPVVRALRAPLWHPRLAGAARDKRLGPHFVVTQTVRGPIVVVDDVCTSGATISRATSVLGDVCAAALVATSAQGATAAVG